MRNWVAMFMVVAISITLSGCYLDDETSSSKCEDIDQATIATIPTYESIAYWEIVQDEIISMLNEHNLYLSATSHGYPCKQFNVVPGVINDDGQVVASGLSEEEYAKVFESVKVALHAILDKYKLAKPKTAFHGCYSIVEIFFDNWFIDENKIYDNVYSRKVASYGVDLLEYYYDYEEKAYIKREGFFPDIWSKHRVYTP